MTDTRIAVLRCDTHSNPTGGVTREWTLTIFDGDAVDDLRLADDLGLRSARCAAESELAHDGYRVTDWHGMTGRLTVDADSPDVNCGASHKTYLYGRLWCELANGHGGRHRDPYSATWTD